MLPAPINEFAADVNARIFPHVTFAVKIEVAKYVSVPTTANADVDDLLACDRELIIRNKWPRGKVQAGSTGG